MPQYKSEYDSYHHLREKAIIFRSDLLDRCLSELATIGCEVERSIVNTRKIVRRLRKEKKLSKMNRRNMGPKKTEKKWYLASCKIEAHLEKEKGTGSASSLPGAM